MKDKIKELFDFQKFEENPKLNKVIRKSQLTDNCLDFDALAGVTAAGDGYEGPVQKAKGPSDMPTPCLLENINERECIHGYGGLSPEDCPYYRKECFETRNRSCHYPRKVNK